MATRRALKLPRLTSSIGKSNGYRGFLTARNTQPLVFHTAVTNKIVTKPIIQATRLVSTTSTHLKGLSPESENPQPLAREEEATIDQATEISAEEYHELSDAYLDNIVAKLEQLQESRDDVDVEFSSGVLTLTFPPNGTYVINKQPPNKQIWLSSPISGPKRYDYVVVGEGQHEKEGGGSGEWIYLRDGSTLSEVLLKEVGVDLSSETIE